MKSVHGLKWNVCTVILDIDYFMFLITSSKTEVGLHFYNVVYGVFAVYKVILGTLDTADSADVEWVYRPYMRTAKKRKFLSNE